VPRADIETVCGPGASQSGREALLRSVSWLVAPPRRFCRAVVTGAVPQ